MATKGSLHNEGHGRLKIEIQVDTQIEGPVEASKEGQVV